MKKAGRYTKLAEWLDGQDRERIKLEFSTIERIIRAPLPTSAVKYQFYWYAGNLIGNVLAERGWRASPDLRARAVEFHRIVVSPPRRVGDVRAAAHVKKDVPPAAEPDLVLVGCVKTKRSGRHPARDLYTSELFRLRRARAEESGKPWFILSAKYGLVSPDEVINSYDRAMADLSTAERREWAAGVLRKLDTAVSPLKGKVVEIHAAVEYVEYGLLEGLHDRGVRTVRPLQYLNRGQQLSWYKDRRASAAREVEKPQVAMEFKEGIRAVTEMLTRDFTEGRLDLGKRPGAPKPGWEAMPEFVAARRLRERGADPSRIRVFITLVSALDRARDADRLWTAAMHLCGESPWVFDPEEIHSRSLQELRRCLCESGVSQRHTVDTAAWRLIAEALVSEDAPRAVRDAVFGGRGEAAELLDAVKTQDQSRQPWFPYLSGPKVSAMWVRMLAAPGGASIENIGVVPVAIDVQVRKVTENLGVTRTRGRELEEVRTMIQNAWREGASHAVGPPDLAGTSAALDPALWFFGKWGCSYCERWRHREPISDVCGRCRFSEWAEVAES